MSKTALCIRPFNFMGEYITENEVVEYDSISGDLPYRIKGGIELDSRSFFAYFKPLNTEDKMSYRDFTYIITNSIFTMSVFKHFDYDGVKNIIIQSPDKSVVFITINPAEDEIRLSFKHLQITCESYDKAVEMIKNFTRKE